MVRDSSLLTEFYRERIEGNLVFLQYLTRDIGEMNRVREAFGEDWEIQESCRNTIFLETQTIQALREEIEHDQGTLKELERRRPTESIAGV